jgi:hypothetical protein
LMMAARGGGLGAVDALLVVSDPRAQDKRGLTASEHGRNAGSPESKEAASRIDAYVLAEDERHALEGVVFASKPRAPSGRRL